MSWLFSQALVVEYLGDTFLDGEPSALSSGKNTQLAYLPPDKMTGFSRLSRFGMMFKPLTESRGEELLMSYLGDFHAKTSLPLEKETDLTESGQECGKRWQGLLARYDQNTHSLRTVQCSLLEDLNESLQTWPKWGLMRNGECYQQPMLEQTIKENEFGLSEKVPNNLDFFHTPCTTGIDGGSNSRRALRKRMNQFPIPQASDCRDRGHMNSPSVQRRLEIGKQVNLSMVVHPTSGQLNPMWVEWLMGWPIGWTDLKPLEMDKSLYVQQQHGNS
jgi:hypothetical protein